MPAPSRTPKPGGACTGSPKVTSRFREARRRLDGEMTVSKLARDGGYDVVRLLAFVAAAEALFGVELLTGRSIKRSAIRFERVAMTDALVGLLRRVNEHGQRSLHEDDGDTEEGSDQETYLDDYDVLGDPEGDG